MPSQPFDFDAIADAYERLGEPLTSPFSADALALAALPSGAAIADVAAGTGALATRAAAAGLAVRASDLSAAMVTRLEAKLAAYPRCSAAVGDCTALDLANGSMAAAFSIFGVAIIPVWKAGLAEMVRVVRSGGFVVVGAWLEDRGSKPFAVLRDTFTQLFPDRLFMPENSFAEWTEATLGDALRAAGCVDVVVHPRTHEVTKGSAAQAAAESMQFAAMIPSAKALAPADLARLESALADGYRAYADADGTIRMPMEALIGIGRVADAAPAAAVGP